MINRAAEFGPSRYLWWKDWRSRAIAIVASGPSVKDSDCLALKGRLPVIAVKEAFWQQVPFADVVYGCEAAWWNFRAGLPGFTGLKVTWDGAKVHFPGIERIRIAKRSKGDRHDHQFSRDILFDEPGLIGSGQASGFQALNLAVQFGASRILMLGFDAGGGKQVHFYGRNAWTGARNPNEVVFEAWVKNFDLAKSTLDCLGVEVVNASPISKISAFRKAGVEETLKAWGL